MQDLWLLWELVRFLIRLESKRPCAALLERLAQAIRAIGSPVSERELQIKLVVVILGTLRPVATPVGSLHLLVNQNV